jgi:hypothetical protein
MKCFRISILLSCFRVLLGWGALLCFALLCFALLCFALLCFALLCFALLCFALLCFALLCFACFRVLRLHGTCGFGLNCDCHAIVLGDLDDYLTT